MIGDDPETKCSPFVDNHAGTASRCVFPKVFIETSDHRNTEIIEFDIPEMTFADVPQKNVLAKIVVRSLAKGAGTGDRATAVVEPVAGDAPVRGIKAAGLQALNAAMDARYAGENESKPKNVTAVTSGGNNRIAQRPAIPDTSLDQDNMGEMPLYP